MIDMCRFLIENGMKLRRSCISLVMSLLFFWVGGASAQMGTVGACPTTPYPPITVSLPTSSLSPLTITVATDYGLPQSVIASVNGYTIDVVFNVQQLFPVPPPQLAICGTVQLYDLPAGRYAVTYLLGFNGNPPRPNATAVVDLAFAIAPPSPVPTIGSVGLLVMVLQILAVAACLMRASAGARHVAFSHGTRPHVRSTPSARDV